MKKRKGISITVLVPAISVIASQQSTCYGLQVGQAEAVPGFTSTSTVAFNYVNSDATFMLLQVWDPHWRVKSSSWNSGTKQWTAPAELPTNPSGGFPDWTGGATLSPDGSTLYHSQNGSASIWRTTKTSDVWLLPTESVPNLDGLAYSTISFNDSFFYGVNSGYDILSSTYDADNDQFSIPILVDSVNTEWAEASPWISYDNALLLFSSNRPGGYGGYDLYSAIWNAGEWQNVTNLGPNVNTSLDELVPCIAEQANLLYFRSGNQLMQAPVPEPTTLLLLGFGAVMLRKR